MCYVAIFPTIRVVYGQGFDIYGNEVYFTVLSSRDFLIFRATDYKKEGEFPLK
jgi:hypothetical protein